MMIILDISKPFQPKPGLIKNVDKTQKGWRFWWLWFAITYSSLSDYEYHKWVSSGESEWVFRETTPKLTRLPDGKELL